MNPSNAFTIAVGVCWLIRIPSLLVVAFATTGLLHVSTNYSDSNIAAYVFMVLAMYGGAFALNDICDKEIDAINKPKRPIPAGRINVSTAWSITKWFFIAALAISLYLGLIATAYVIFFIAASTWYSYKGKRIGWFKTLLAVALSNSVLGFIILISERPMFGIYMLLSSSLLSVGRELIMDTRDLEGDSINGIITVSCDVGAKLATAYGLLAIIAGVLAAFMPETGLLFPSVPVPVAALAILDVSFIAIMLLSFALIKSNRLWMLSESCKLYYCTFLAVVFFAWN